MALIRLSSYEEIMSVANQLKSKAGEMETLLGTTVKGLFEQIGDGSDIWSGNAANTARDEFNTMSEKFPEFYQAVDSCYGYLNAVAANYQAADAAAQAAAQGQR